MLPPHEEALIDAVWTAAYDGGWHRIEDVAESVRLHEVEVTLIVNFLEKYGFAEDSRRGERMFRTINGTPSPTRTAWNLESLFSAVKPLNRVF